MQGVRDPRGPVVVCGWIDGHNGAGAYRGMSPYIGVLTGPRNDAEFVVVGIGSYGPRASRGSFALRGGRRDVAVGAVTARLRPPPARASMVTPLSSIEPTSFFLPASFQSCCRS